MPYSDQTEYPRGIFNSTALTNVAADVGTPSVDQKVSHYILQGGAALRTVIFRNSAGTAEFFRLNVPANATLIVNRGFHAEGGLEILTAAAAGDVNAVIFYF